MPSKKLAPADEAIDNLICETRGVRVILDTDPARVYGVPTFRFNETIKRNKNPFPPDFTFQLSQAEFEALTSQIGMSGTANSSQIAMSSRKHRGRAYRPYAFTEHGALQAANILRGTRAVQMLKQVVTTLKMVPLVEAVPIIISIAAEFRDAAGRPLRIGFPRWDAGLPNMRRF